MITWECFYLNTNTPLSADTSSHPHKGEDINISQIQRAGLAPQKITGTVYVLGRTLRATAIHSLAVWHFASLIDQRLSKDRLEPSLSVPLPANRSPDLQSWAGGTCLLKLWMSGYLPECQSLISMTRNIISLKKYRGFFFSIYHCIYHLEPLPADDKKAATLETVCVFVVSSQEAQRTKAL